MKDQKYQQRIARASKILNDSIAMDNGVEIPEFPDRYLGLEQFESGETVWAFFAAGPTEATHEFDMSETSGIDRRRLIDLDTGKVQEVVFGFKKYVPTTDTDL